MTLPKEVRDMLLGSKKEGTTGALTGMFSGPGAGRDEAFNRSFLDPERYKQTGDVLHETSSGANLDVANTESGQSLIQALNNQYDSAISKNMADNRSRFAMAGHGGEGASGPLEKAQLQTIRAGREGATNELMKRLFDERSVERQRQLAATGAEQNFQQTPYNMFSDMAQLFKQEKNTSPRANPVASALGK